jgi:(2Fe-2S) ferredoxin
VSWIIGAKTTASAACPNPDTLRAMSDVHGERLEAIARSLGIGALDRHILLCAEQTTPRCCSYEESAAVWEHLKGRLKDLGLAAAPPRWRGSNLDDPPPPGEAALPGRVLRTKVDCLRICEQGPIAVVYPDGTWYRGVTVDVIDRIIDEHLIAGAPVIEFVFAVDDLSSHGGVD